MFSVGICFEKISVLDSNFVHGYIIIKCRSSLIYFWSYNTFSTLKNSFRLIAFENISVLDSYLIHRYIIIK